MTTPTPEALKSMCRQIVNEPKLYGDAEIVARALLAMLETPTGWQPIETAPKDAPIIYWHAMRFVSSCEWRDPDEGCPGGWWDDAITENVEPNAWLMVLPPTQELRS